MDKKEEHRSERKAAEKPRWDNWHVPVSYTHLDVYKRQVDLKDDKPFREQIYVLIRVQ